MIPKKLIAQLLSTVLMIAVIVMLGFAVNAKTNSKLNHCTISVDALADKKYLISKKDVKNIMDNTIGFDIMNAAIEELDLMAIESAILKDKRVLSAEVYVQHKNEMMVHVVQRKPIVRISDMNANNYYLDEEGKRVPHVLKESVRVPVVTGYVDGYTKNYKQMKKNNLNDIYLLINKIRQDDFLAPLVEQVHIEKNKEIILVPKMGKKKIIIGDTENLDDKLYNLKTYYRQGTKKVGIDKFAVLDLRYKNQVVGRT